MTGKTLLLFMLVLVCLTGFRNAPGALRHIEIADSHVSEGNFEAALEHYSMAVAMEPGNPAHYMTRGFFLLKMKRHDEALQDFSACIRLEPAKADCYLSRGLVQSSLGRESEAEADFNMACRLGIRDGCVFAGN